MRQTTSMVCVQVGQEERFDISAFDSHTSKLRADFFLWPNIQAN